MFGLSSHWPYEAVLLVAHISSALLLFTLIRRQSGDLAAFASALLLLVLGSGGTDIVSAFQIGFVGSVAFGLLSVLLLDRPSFRRGIARGAEPLAPRHLLLTTQRTAVRGSCGSTLGDLVAVSEQGRSVVFVWYSCGSPFQASLVVYE